MELRVASFNIQHGRLPDGQVDVGAVARALAPFQADVVAIQEADRWQARSGNVDSAEVIASGLGFDVWRYQPGVAGAVEPARAPGDDPGAALLPLARAKGWTAKVRGIWTVLASRAGRRAVRTYLGVWLGRHRAAAPAADTVPGHGIALMSRYPVTRWEHLRLPLRSLWLGGRLQVGRDDPRVALAAHIETPHGPVTVCTTHLSTHAWSNRRQLRWLVRHLSQDHARRDGAGNPVLLMGDLNIRGAEPAETTGWRDLIDSPTYPRHQPFLQLDHVLLNPDLDGMCVAAEAEVVDLAVSDHRAVVATLQLARASGGNFGTA
ncbi:MAG: endonuclease/exonuclease/phosphatase family protein [Cellulomonadaceae bacterium]|jgi:endonuclease/exonuclease/phosphatase family metal-dependent hydrolase|nr:endonuclease/exonuclease/phosphatase family protein [Cellulomonadaceae bacterium]